VTAGEQVCITLTAANTSNLAAFPAAPSCGPWSTPPPPAPTNPRTGRFIANGPIGATCVVDIVFNFVPDENGEYPGGAQYEVRIQGNPEEDSFSETVTPPPPVQARQYVFRTDRV